MAEKHILSDASDFWYEQWYELRKQGLSTEEADREMDRRYPGGPAAARHRALSEADKGEGETRGEAAAKFWQENWWRTAQGIIEYMKKG